MSETERLLAAVVDMQHYVTHDVDQSKCAACPRWDELQSAAMAAAGQIDALSAEIAALRIENDTLRAALERAPHGPLCAVVGGYGYPCNCWKADALRAAGGE